MFKKLALLFVIAALPVAVRSQSIAISGQVIGPGGVPQAYAEVRVCLVTSSGTPCSPTVNIYSDYLLTQQIPNPTTADQYGNFTVYVNSGVTPALYLVQEFTGLGAPVFSYTFGSGGSGTLNPGGGYSLPSYPSSSTRSVSPINITTDVTGNNLFFPAGGDAVLGTDLPTGSMAASANAAVTARSNLAYAAVADYQGKFAGSISSSSTTVTCATCGWTSAAVVQNKWLVLYPNGSWTPPFAPVAGNLALNSAPITGWISPTQVTIGRASTVSENVLIAWGTDLVTAMNACAAQGNGMCLLPSLSTGTSKYLAASVPYSVVTGASDDGSTGAPAGGSGGTVTCTPTSGSLTSGGCVVSGGTLYTPGSTLQTTYVSGGGCPFGYNFGTCGQAWVKVTANGSGVPTTPTVLYGGFGLTTPVVFSINALSGGGATATATETAGTMNPPVLVTAGAGFTASSLVSFVATGGGCTPIATWYGITWAGTGYWATNASGQLTGSPTVTANAAGCTSNPTIIIGGYAFNSGTGGSPNWIQGANVAPLDPIIVPVQVMLGTGASFNGTGGHGTSSNATIYGTWDGVTVDNNQAHFFGGNLLNADLGSFQFSDMFDPLFTTNNSNNSKVHDWYTNNSTGLCMYTTSTDVSFSTDDITCNGYAGVVNGGQWHNRVNFPLGLGGFFDAYKLGSVTPRVIAYGGANSVSQKLDDWFANYFWHPEFTANSTDWPSGETCKFPQTPNQRQMSTQIGYGSQPQYFVNKECYRGISSTGLAILTRDARGSGSTTINNLTCKNISRACLVGSPGSMFINNITVELGSPISGTSDPYRNATTLEGFMIYFDGTSAFGAKLWINGGSYSGSSSPTQPLWDTTSPTANGLLNTGLTYATGVTGIPQNFIYDSEQVYPFGLQIGPNIPQPVLDIYSKYGNTVPFVGNIQGYLNSCVAVYGNDATPGVAATGTVDMLFCNSGNSSQVPLTTPSLGVNGGTAMTGNQGTGTKVQHSTGSFTSGHLVSADSAGNTVDSTIPAAGVPQVGTSVSGQAACWTTSSSSASVLGHCTSVVGAGGACTCVP